METAQILATGGVSGSIVAILFVVYLFCKHKRSRCTSDIATDESGASTPPREEAPQRASETKSPRISVATPSQ